MESSSYIKHPVWDRELTGLEKMTIKQIMDANPVIDYMLAQTMVLMPPDKMKEICDRHMKDKPEAEPARMLTEDEQRAGHVLSDEEQKIVEDERTAKELVQKEKMDKWALEQDQKKELEEESYESD